MVTKPFFQADQKCPDATMIEGRGWCVECGLNEFTINHSLLSTFEQWGIPRGAGQMDVFQQPC